MNRRIERLERALTPDGCPDLCHEPRFIETVFVDVDEDDDANRDVELCPRCGREAGDGAVTRILVVRPAPQEHVEAIGGNHG